MNCKICTALSKPFGEAKILGKYPVNYFRCEDCGFIQTEEPYWLEEAYSETMTRSDIGLISRNLQMAAQTQKLLLTCFDPQKKFIDYGGGYGIFVRIMRDRGFDFYRHDPRCKNLFAEGFEAPPGTKYELLTAWEVFEHLQDPLTEIEKMLSFSRNLFFSTILLPKTPKPPGEWWYYGPEHGQHISFYSAEALHIISKKFNLQIHYSNGSLHFLGEQHIRPLMVRITFDRRLRWLQKMLAKPVPPSRLGEDYHLVTGNYLK